MPPDSPFRPLDISKKEIRILYIEVDDDLTSAGGLPLLSLAGKKGRETKEPLTFRLDIISLLDTNIPFYEAISHSSDDGKETSEIHLDGVKSSISMAVEQTLRAICHQHGHTPIWLDSLCINHDDARERESQLTLLGEIYAKSARSLVWLGEGRQCTQTALSSIRELRNYINRTEPVDWRAPQSWPPQTKTMSQETTPILSSLKWHAIYQLFQEPWFGRTWLIQEASRAKQVVCYLGRYRVIWTELAGIATWLHFQRQKLPCSPTQEALEGMANIAAMWMDRCRETGIFATYLQIATSSLDKMPNTTRPIQQLTSQRETEPEVPPLQLKDLDEPADIVHARAARAAIIEMADLGLLKHAQSLRNHKDGNTKDGFPSWALRLDLRDRYLLNPITSQSFDFNADESVPLCISATGPSSAILRVEGVVVDTIRDVSPRMQWPLKGDRRSDAMAAAAVMRKMFAWTRQRLPRWPEAALARKFALTVAAGQDAEGRDLANSRQYSRRLHKGFMSTTPISVTQGSIRIECPMACADELDSDAMYAVEAMVKSGQNRTLFITDQGRLGSGTDNVQPGDKLCILFGGDVPFILRPLDDIWHLVGDSFVDGIMFGSYIRDLKIAGRFHAETRWFNIH